MKTRLLRKARKRVKIFERNGVYYVYSGEFCMEVEKLYSNAVRMRRKWILYAAKDMFRGKKYYKKRIV